MRKKSRLRISAIPEEELELLEQEIAQQPERRPISNLEVAWDTFINQPGAAQGDELMLADLQSGNLYSIYAQPATDASGNRVVIYPVVEKYIRDYARAETFEALPDGSFNWSDIEQKYFPSGFAPLERKPEVEGRIKASAKVPADFWKRVLANLLRNYSDKKFYEKSLDNPYIVKKNT
jgi:hypothetical protein